MGVTDGSTDHPQRFPIVLAPEQARDLVDHFGGNRAAASAIGVSHPTICYWLDPAWAERKREAARVRYDRLTGLEYNRLLLRRRRTKALWRRALKGALQHG